MITVVRAFTVAAGEFWRGRCTCGWRSPVTVGYRYETARDAWRAAELHDDEMHPAVAERHTVDSDVTTL